MEDKCSKYEGLFVFSDSDELEKHLSECDECRKEHEKMEKVSKLLDEVKFYYRSKNKRLHKLKIACAVSLVIFSSLSFGAAFNNEDFMDTLMYGDVLSAEDLGFPVDSYGFLMVDE